MMKHSHTYCMAILLMILVLASPALSNERGVQLEFLSNTDVVESAWLVDGMGTSDEPYIVQPPDLIDAFKPAGLIQGVTVHVIVEGFAVTAPAPNTGRAGVFLIRDSENITIRDAEFYGFEGISIEDSSGITVSNIHIGQIGERYEFGDLGRIYKASGVHVRGSEGVRVVQAHITGFDTGVVYSLDSQSAIVENSTFLRQYISIAVWLGVDHVNIENNTIIGSTEGVLLSGATRAHVANNTVHNTATGFVMHNSSHSTGVGGNIHVVDNAACNVNHAFLPHSGYAGVMARNLIDGSESVAVDIRDDWAIKDNVIRNSGIALDASATRDYLVIGNDISNSTTSIRARNDVSLEGNWWGRPGGPEPGSVQANGHSVDTTPSSDQPHDPLLPGTTCSE